VTVTAPAGGDIWIGGSTAQVEWTISEAVVGGSFEIVLMQGTTEVAILGSNIGFVPGTGYSQQVDVPTAADGSYYVRVWYWNEAAIRVRYADSGAIAVVAPLPTVVSPNGAEQWAQGSPQQITWTTATAPAGGFFRVYLRAPAGSFTSLGAPSVASADTGTGTDFAMAWTPTQAPATGYMVRVWYADAAGNWLFYDQSDAGFEIQ